MLATQSVRVNNRPARFARQGAGRERAGDRPVVVPEQRPPDGQGDLRRIFDDAVYDRGALTLHHLRELAGDADFFAILRAWTSTRRYGDGTTPDFRALAERITGADLGGFFQTWLHTPGRPDLGAATLTAPAVPKSWSKIVAAQKGAHR